VAASALAKCHVLELPKQPPPRIVAGRKTILQIPREIAGIVARFSRGFAIG